MKKMRRLIPAIAMLLVSAVMLSTASFAWFTMNESVTATGMQVKAKASGNLLIKESKMTAADQDITVALTNRNKNASTDIIPVTYVEGWKVPTSSGAVDPLYGGMAKDDVLKNADKSTVYAESPYFVDYTVYVATAGDELSAQNLYVTMNMVSAAEEIVNAYSIAFYVGGTTDTDLGTFAGYVNYKTFVDNPGAKVYLLNTHKIPTTLGKNAESAVGLKITMRVFVDGALKYDKQVASKEPDYKLVATGATYGAGDTLKYYEKQDDGTYKPLDKSQWVSTTSIAGYYTWNGDMKDGAMVDKYYVNNADIPTGATEFDVTIGATEGTLDANVLKALTKPVVTETPDDDNT